jgi:hypothetical protein
MKKAFTLETRIKKFYSTMQQVSKMNKGLDGIDTSMLVSAKNSDEMLEFFNVNYQPYIKMNEVKKRDLGVAAMLPDGAGIYVQKNYTAENCLGTCNTYIWFCVNYNDCKTLDESTVAYGDGKKVFRFYVDGSPEALQFLSGWDNNRETLVDACKEAPVWCSALIQYDGWEVRDDYPW